MIKKSLLLALFTLILQGLKADQLLQDESLMQSQIKHVVVVMLENRSFDNVLAWLYDQNNLPEHFIPDDTDPHYLGLSEKTLSQYSNPLIGSSGEVVFSCQPIKGIPSVAASKYLNSPKFDPFEPFTHVTQQIFNGKVQPNMTGFIQDYASLWWEFEWNSHKEDISSVMETYTERELPILYGLAKQYAVSDLWFSSVPTQTNPNRAFAACGTSEGQIVNGKLGKSLFHADTIWNRLTEESPETTWMIFWQADMVPGIIPGPYSGTNTFANLAKIPDLASHFQMMDSFHELARNGQLPDFSFVEPQWTISLDLDPSIKLTEELSASILSKCSKKLVESEVASLNAKALLFGLQGNDFHPPGDVRSGENFLANIYTSLTANPEAWNNTLLIITFDEHGGVFDHLPPPAAIPPDDHFENGFKFDRYGVRVPALFISPKIERGTVIRSDDPNIPFDHTSLIATILKWKKIDETRWNMGKRAAVAPTFDRVITRMDPRLDSILTTSQNLIDQADEKNCVHMGDKFYLRDKDRSYVAKARMLCKHHCRVGAAIEKIALQFIEGSGKITHGSFILIKSTDPALGKANILETVFSHCDCCYEENKHALGQWWTIKSVDHPYLGYPIQYGDRVYLESHVYLDLFQYVPGRLTKKDGLFGEFLMTKSITEDDSADYYWIIEKP